MSNKYSNLVEAVVMQNFGGSEIMDLQTLDHIENDHKLIIQGDGKQGLHLIVRNNADKTITDFNLTKSDVDLLLAFIEKRRAKVSA